MSISSDITRLQTAKSDLATAIENKGVSVPSSTLLDGYAALVDSIDYLPSASRNDVNFFDYNGAILYSYSASDALALTALPDNPTHSGLTAQGWNYALAEMQAEVTAQGRCDVGQMYVTDDGKTRIYVTMEEGRLSPYLGICPNGTVIVDWGDDTETETLTGTSLTTVVNTSQHTYTSAGNYVITLTVSDGSFAFTGNGNCSYILRKSLDTTAHIHKAYLSSIRRIELGTGATIGDYGLCYCSGLKTITVSSTTGFVSSASGHFRYCYGLQAIVLPPTITAVGGSMFNEDYSLKVISLPNSLTSISAYGFYYCRSISNITVPSSVTSISTFAFGNCLALCAINVTANMTSIPSLFCRECCSLASITFPSGITSIGSQSFQYCYGLGAIHFKGTTPPTISNSNAFDGIPTDCKIYIPSGYLSTYTSATNYPDSSTYTYVEE